MARKIIVLERVDEPSDSSFRYALWADVPASRQVIYADSLKTSLVSDITAPELAALRAGAVVERVGTAQFPASTTLATMKTVLIAAHAAFQADVTSRNAWKYYGTFWDGTTWTAGGVA